MKNFTLIRQSLLLALVVFIIFCWGCIQTEYEYQYLLPPGWIEAYAEDINDSGVVVGFGYDNETKKGFIYKDGKYTELLPPGWETAEAVCINNNGVVAGNGYDETEHMGFIYDNGEYTELLPQGWEWAVATGINDDGVVVGSGSVIDVTVDMEGIYNNKGFIYHDGVYTELLPLGWEEAEAVCINNNGVVAGNGYDETTYMGQTLNVKRVGFIYDDGEYTELLPPGTSEAWVRAINDNGAVVVSGTGSTHGIGFIYKYGEYTELPDEMPRAIAINNNEVVVGFVCPGGVPAPPDYWKCQSFICKDGEVTELKPPGYLSSILKSINNEGALVGYVKGKYRAPRGFIATPITP